MEPKLFTSPLRLRSLIIVALNYACLFGQRNVDAQQTFNNDVGFNRQQQQFASPSFALPPQQQQQNNFLPQQQNQLSSSDAGLGQRPAPQQQQLGPPFPAAQHLPQPPIFAAHRPPNTDGFPAQLQFPNNNNIFDINNHPLMPPNNNVFSPQPPPIISTTVPSFARPVEQFLPPSSPPQQQQQQIFDLARDQAPSRPPQLPGPLRPDSPRRTPTLATPPTQQQLLQKGNNNNFNADTNAQSVDDNNLLPPPQEQRRQLPPSSHATGPLRPDQFDQTHQTATSSNLNSQPVLLVHQAAPPAPPLRPDRPEQAALANDNVVTLDISQSQQRKPTNISFGFGPSRGQLLEFHQFQLQQQQQQQQSDARPSTAQQSTTNRRQPLLTSQQPQTQFDMQQLLDQQQRELAELQRELNTVDNFFVKNDIHIGSTPLNSNFGPQKPGPTPPTIVKASVPRRDDDFFRPTPPTPPIVLLGQQQHEQARFEPVLPTDAPTVASSANAAAVSINRDRLIQQAKPLQPPLLFGNEADVISLSSRTAESRSLLLANAFKKAGLNKFANPQANAMTKISRPTPLLSPPSSSIPTGRQALGGPFDFSVGSFEKFVKQNADRTKSSGTASQQHNANRLGSSDVAGSTLAVVQQQQALNTQQQRQQDQTRSTSTTLPTFSNAPRQASVIVSTDRNAAPSQPDMTLVTVVSADNAAIQTKLHNNDRSITSLSAQGRHLPEDTPANRRLAADEQQQQQQKDAVIRTVQNQPPPVLRTPLAGVPSSSFSSFSSSRRPTASVALQLHDDQLPPSSVKVAKSYDHQSYDQTKPDSFTCKYCPPVSTQKQYYSAAGERSLLPSAPAAVYQSGVQALQNTINAGVSYLNSLIPTSLVVDPRLLQQYVPPLLAPILAPQNSNDLAVAPAVINFPPSPPPPPPPPPPPLQPAQFVSSTFVETFNPLMPPRPPQYASSSALQISSAPARPTESQPQASNNAYPSSSSNVFVPLPYPPPAPPSVVAEALAAAQGGAALQSPYQQKRPSYVNVGPLPHNKPTQTEYQTAYVQTLYNNNNNNNAYHQQQQQHQAYQPAYRPVYSG